VSSKKKTTSNSTTTVTPNNPQWITQAVQNQIGALGALAGASPYSYVAGPSPLQTQGFDIAQGLGPSSAGWINQAAGAAQDIAGYTPQSVSASAVDPTKAFASLGVANPTNALTQLLSGTPSNPYLAAANQANINQALQGYGDALASASNTLTRQVLPSIRSGGVLSGQYGGSRQGIAEGVALGDVGTQLAQNARNLAQSAMDSGNRLYGGAYESAQDRMATTANGLAGLAVQNAQQNASNDLAAQQSNQSAGLQGENLNLGAAQYLGGLGQYGLNTLGSLGATQQQLAQQYAQAPLTTAQAINAMYGQLPLGLFSGSTTVGNGTATEKTGGLLPAVNAFSNLVSAFR